MSKEHWNYRARCGRGGAIICTTHNVLRLWTALHRRRRGDGIATSQEPSEIERLAAERQKYTSVWSHIQGRKVCDQ